MKKGLLLVLAILFVFCCAGCSGLAVSEKESYTASQVAATFLKAGLPLSNITVYTEETDTNQKLGRPGEYTSKVSWGDTRYPESMIEDPDFATVEVFENQEDLETRKAYIESVFEAMPATKQYVYAVDLALLRLDYALTPQEAEEYSKILQERNFVSAEEAETLLKETIESSSDNLDLDNEQATPEPSESTGSNPYGFGDVPCVEPGQYKVGTDMDAGEYILVATTDVAGYFCVSSDANGDDILFNDNFSTNSIITVKDGEYVELSRCIAMPLEEFHKNYAVPKEASGVMFKVGVDIEAGEYKVMAEEGETGYYCVYGDSRHDDIIANDNFEGSAYVTVKDGQYLVLNRCLLAE